jgi:hypothetical protein
MPQTKCLAIIASVAAMTLVASAGRAQQPPPQTPNMTFFVTSAGRGKGADLGGLEGADRQCQTLAQAAGAGGKTWRAYLSTQAVDGATAVNARDRIGAGPWQNFKGEVIAKSVDELHGDQNKLSIETALTERGTMVAGRGYTPNYHDVLTGSQPDGRAFHQMRTGPAAIGRAAPRVRRWSGITTARECATTPNQNHGIHRIHRVGLMAVAARTI